MKLFKKKEAEENAAAPQEKKVSRKEKKEKKDRGVIGILEGFIRVIAALILIVGAALTLRVVINHSFVQQYNNGEYSEMPEVLLVPVNFGESHVAYYNMGNIDFHLGAFDKAIQNYQKALQDKKLPEDRECMVRINLALALCHTIDFEHLDLKDKDAVDAAVQTLLEARYYLTEKGCASEGVDTDDGHSPDAEKLKHDIDKKLAELMPHSSQSQDQNQDGNGNSNSNSSSNSSSSNSSSSNSSSSNSSSSDSSSSSANSGGQSKEDQEKEKKEKEKQAQEQEDLEKKLDEQKEDLEKKGNPNYDDGDYDYEYKESGEVSGYGEGTPW